MADTTLVEPGLEGLHMALIYEGAGNRLVFPHVDSCVALIVLCDKGEMVGAHVARTEKGQELAANSGMQNAFKHLFTMLGMCPSGVKRIAFICDAGDSDENVYGQKFYDQWSGEGIELSQVDLQTEGKKDVYGSGANVYVENWGNRRVTATKMDGHTNALCYVAERDLVD